MKSKTVTTAALVMLLLITVSATLGGCAYITGEALTDHSSNPTAETVIKNVTPEEAHQLLSLSSKWVHVIDVRTPEEFVGGYLGGAVNIDLNSGDFREQINQLPKDTPYLVYCRSGSRNAAASAVMAELGFREIYNMTGGISAWQAAGYPVVH